MRTQTICLIPETRGEVPSVGRPWTQAMSLHPVQPSKVSRECLLPLHSTEDKRTVSTGPRNFAMQGHELKPTSAPGKRPQLLHDTSRARTHSLTPGDIPPLGTATAPLPQARARPYNFLDSQLGQQTRAAVTHLGAAESSGCWSGSGAAVADEGPRRWASAWPGSRWW